MGLTKDHYIQLKDGIFDGTSKDDLDNLFKALAADPNRESIVLHFHGGLVNVASAMQTAEDLTQHFLSINAYQIFFIWETGVIDVVQQQGGLDIIKAQLEQVGKEEIFQQLLMRVLQFAKAKVDSLNAGGARSVDGGLDLPDEADVWRELHAPKDGREPFSDVSPALPDQEQLQDQEKQQFQDTLTQDPNPALQVEVQKIADGYRLTKQANGSTPPGAAGGLEGEDPTAASATRISLSILEQMDQQSNEGAVRGIGIPAFDFVIGKAIEVLSQVIDRFSKKTDHGLYTTVVEEILRAFYLSNIGKNIWDHIKQEAIDAFNQPDRGGAVFLQSLKAYYQNDHRPRITLVGHSAGAVYICELLQHAEALPPEVQFDIVFLAPACTYQLFADTLQACKGRIASIRIFAMSDQLEQADALVPGLYPRSLLYLVSGLFEDAPDTPILGMQRFFSTEAPFNIWPEVPLTFTYLSASQHNNVWSSVDTGNGLSSHATKHGDFYREEVTLTSLGFILANGL
ncbi:MAG: hypothetical protein NVSMB27_08070 [Ktedonobacteraceae bacterium]